MSRQRIEHTATTTADPAAVYALLRDGGTEIRWVSQFDPKYPGTGGLVRRGLDKFIAENVNGLASYASAPR